MKINPLLEDKNCPNDLLELPLNNISEIELLRQLSRFPHIAQVTDKKVN